MTKKEILENNKLIIEFMSIGFAKGYTSDSRNPGYLFDKKPQYNPDIWATLIYSIPNVEYHKSWDWLMPVIEKISKLKLTENVYWIAVCHRHINTPFQIIYDSIIEFIKWYNLNK